MLERKLVKCTRTLAKRFADMPGCKQDRNEKSRISRLLKKEIEAGRFRFGTFASAICNGTEYRVNGKHTSTILRDLDPFPDEIQIVVERYDCETEEDMAELYATFDRSESARTTNDINAAFKVACPELQDVSLRIVSKCVSAIAYAAHEDGYSSAQYPDDRARAMIDNVPFIAWVAGLAASPTDFKHLNRHPVIAAMFKTWHKSKADATKFWTAVRDGSGVPHTVPDRMLNKVLLTSSVNMGVGAKNGSHRKLQPREMYVKCLHAWNAWRKGGDTDLKYYGSGKTPPVA